MSSQKSCRRFRNVVRLQQPCLIVTDNRKGFNDPAVQEKSAESMIIALLGSVNREVQIEAEEKNVSYTVDWERGDLPFLCFLFLKTGSFQYGLVIRPLIQSTISCLCKDNRYHVMIGVVIEGGDGSLHGFTV